MQKVLEAAGIKPDNYTLFGYASAQTIVAALKGTKGGNVEAQIKWLHGNSVPSAVGKLSWTEKGDVKDFKFVFYKFDDKGNPVPAS